MHSKTILSLLAISSTAAAKVIQSLQTVPQGWVHVRDAAPTDRISLKVALHQQRGDDLEKVVLEVSTPGHPNYGMHLTRDQLRLYTAPSSDAVTAVSEWLRQHDIAPSVDNDWLSFTTTVEQANRLLDTQFGWYKADGSKSPVLRTLSYSVPDNLVSQIDLIQPTTRFGTFGPRRSSLFRTNYLPDVIPEASCGSAITPDCLKSLYGINYTVTNPAGNLVGFASYLEEYARYDDLSLFQNRFATSSKGQNFSVTLINNGLNDQNSFSDSGEANLDVQYILGVSSPIPIIEYSTGGRGPLVPTPDEPTLPGSNEPYLEFLTYLLALNDSQLPQTLSTSYGEEEQSVPADYAFKICNMFMQLGARGVSVLFSSGDSGPGDRCVRISDGKPYFQPTFPAGCPYVTAVGGTYQTSPEIAVGFSSGGFSSLHTRPSWQDSAVSSYLKSLGKTYAPYFNASNRGFPDVAAQGNDFYVYDQGRLSQLSGTSASSPVFAGVVALLNAARRTKGLPPLGFLNPWLYNNSAALTDITGGSSVGCQDRTYFSRPASWNATKGWDPVTGLGTPNFPLLLNAAAPGVKNE